MLRRCLDDDSGLLRTVAVEQILREAEPPSALLDEALRAAARVPRSAIETPVLQRRVGLETLRLLLRHPHWEVALAAACGEWCGGEPGGQRVRPGIQGDWREAILRAGGDGGGDLSMGLRYWLSQILASDSQLAFDWLRRRLAPARDHLSHWLQKALEAATGTLDRDQRGQLLAELEEGAVADALAPLLVRRDVELYGLLLRRRCRTLAGRSLYGPPDEGWSHLAVAALEAGYPEVDIALDLFDRAGDGFPAYGANPHRGWEPLLRSLADHPDERLRAVACQALKILDRFNLRAVALERQVEMHGLGAP